MADIIAKNVTQGITVTDGSNNPVALPRNAEEIITKQSNFETFLSTLVRTGGLGKLQRDGNIYYDFFGKAKMSRNIQSTVDNATGLHKGQMYGDQKEAVPGTPDVGSTYGYVAPTTIKIFSDSIKLTGGQFFKEIITKREQELENLPTLAANRISEYRDGLEEEQIGVIKAAIVASVGTIGKAATDSGFTLPSTGAGVRNLAKSYTIDEAGGLAAFKDIKAAIDYKSKIGKEDGTGVEASYILARGINVQDSNVLIISSNVDTALTIAFKESPSGTFPGLQVDQTLGSVSSLFGMKVWVSDLPQKGGKNFNWALVESGKHGAIAMPSVFDFTAQVRPHYEGVATLADIIEGAGGAYGVKLMQPELVFGSFEV